MDVEELIFNMYKDTQLGTVSKFRSKFYKKFKNINWYELYAKINNYQIKKYGISLNDRQYRDEEFYKKMKESASHWKYDKTKRRR